MLIAPLLLIHGGTDAAASSASARPSSATARSWAGPGDAATSAHSVAAAAGAVSIADSPVRNDVATTTTAVPAPTTTTTTRVPTTTTTVAPTTTTTSTTTTRPAPVAGSSVQTTGSVTYYDHPAGTCASPRLPFGTVVEVTNPANGASVTCVVDDREEDTARSIDLATASFAQIAPLGQGVVNAQLRW